MSKRKTYRVTLVAGWMPSLKRELKAWSISASYEIEGDTLTTKSSNVIDVVTECFIELPHLYKIEEVKE